MEIRVLGCYGSQLPGYNTTSFLLDGKILLDGGTITSVLTTEEQLKIEVILITHAHLDHIRDIMFLADNLCYQKKKQPLLVLSTSRVIAALRRHIFNNERASRPGGRGAVRPVNRPGGGTWVFMTETPTVKRRKHRPEGQTESAIFVSKGETVSALTGRSADGVRLSRGGRNVARINSRIMPVFTGDVAALAAPRRRRDRRSRA